MPKFKSILLFFTLLLFINIPSTTIAQKAFNMTRLGDWTTPGLGYNDCWGYANATHEYAIIGSRTKVHFIDVTDPICPVLVNEFTPGASSGWRDFKTYRNYVYACADQGSEGLLIFDMGALPNTITYLGNETNVFTRSHNIYIDEQHGRLYTAGANTQSGGIIVFDIATDPENPILLASVGLPGGYIHDVHVVDNIAYCSHLSGGFYIYDLTDPTNPITLGQLTSYPGSVFNHSAWLSDAGTHVVFCDERHGEPVKIVDITDPTDMLVTESNLFKSALLAPDVTNSIAHNPFVKGNLAFISYYHEGLQIFDISDPNNVVNVAYYDSYENTNYGGYSGVWGTYPFLPSGNILISDRTNGLFIVKMGCPPNLLVNTPTVSGLYAAADGIFTIGGQIVEDKTIFRGKECVYIHSDFEVIEGVTFEVSMDGCD